MNATFDTRRAALAALLAMSLAGCSVLATHPLPPKPADPTDEPTCGKAGWGGFAWVDTALSAFSVVAVSYWLARNGSVVSTRERLLTMAGGYGSAIAFGASGAVGHTRRTECNSRHARHQDVLAHGVREVTRRERERARARPKRCAKLKKWVADAATPQEKAQRLDRWVAECHETKSKSDRWGHPPVR